MQKENVLDKKYPSLLIAAVIVYSIITFSLETFENLPVKVVAFLDVSEYFVVAIFTFEYLYRLYYSKKRLAFIFSFYGVIDLIAIIPFYLTFMMDLRALRLIRMLRLIRLLKLVRYNNAISRISQAFIKAKEELIISIFSLACVIYFAAFGIYQLEHEAQPDKFSNILDALWWAVATITTVGYGDVYPITIMGRLFTFVILIIGLGLIAVPSGIIVASLLGTKSMQGEPLDDKSDDLGHNECKECTARLKND